MKFTAIIPVVFYLIALILTFLIMFAGSSKGFMEEYALVTMNTSRIGYNIINTSQPTNTSDIFLNIFNTVTNTVGGFVEGTLNSVAKDIGLHDYYSGHLLTYCEGFYTPTPVPNATLSLGNIDQNTTYCANKTTNFYFNPSDVLQNELNQAGHGDIKLQDLKWPTIIDDGFQAMRTTSQTMFAFYCISIILIFAAFCLAVTAVFLGDRLNFYANLSIDWAATVVMIVASAIATYIVEQSATLINNNGNQIGITATKGTKFVALTWAATALVIAASLIFCTDCIVTKRKQKRAKKPYISEPKLISMDTD